MGVFSGSTICISGVFSITQKELTELLIKNGAEIASTPNKSCTYLVADSIGSSKTMKAEKDGIPVVTEEWVQKSIKAGKKSTDASLFLSGGPSGSSGSSSSRCGSKKKSKKVKSEEEVDDDEEEGVKPKKRSASATKSSSTSASSSSGHQIFSGVVFCVSSSFCDHPDEMTKLILAGGGSVANRPTKECTRLVIMNGSTKATKAQKHGIPTVTEKWVTIMSTQNPITQKEEEKPKKEALSKTTSSASSGGSVFSGETFCVSGSFSISQAEMKSLIIVNGGSVVESPNKKCTYLVADSIGSSKTMKAQKDGIKIVTEEWVNDSIAKGKKSTEKKFFLSCGDDTIDDVDMVQDDEEKSKPAKKKTPAKRKTQLDDAAAEEDDDGPKKKSSKKSATSGPSSSTPKSKKVIAKGSALVDDLPVTGHGTTRTRPSPWFNDAIQTVMTFFTWKEFAIRMQVNRQWCAVARKSPIRFKLKLSQKQLELCAQSHSDLRRHIDHLQCQLKVTVDVDDADKDEKLAPNLFNFPCLTDLQVKLTIDFDELLDPIETPASCFAPAIQLIEQISQQATELKSLRIGFKVPALESFVHIFRKATNTFRPLKDLVHLESLDVRLLNIDEFQINVQDACPPCLVQEHLNDIREIPSLTQLSLDFADHNGGPGEHFGLVPLDLAKLTHNLSHPLKVREVSLSTIDRHRDRYYFDAYEYDEGDETDSFLQFLPLIPSLTKIRLAGLTSQYELPWFKKAFVGQGKRGVHKCSEWSISVSARITLPLFLARHFFFLFPGRFPNLVDLTLIGSADDGIDGFELDEPCTGPAVMTVAATLTQLKRLDLEFPDLTSDVLMDGLRPLTQLEWLTVRESDALHSLEFLSVVPQLSTFQLVISRELVRKMSGVDDLRPILQLKHLQALALTGINTPQAHYKQQGWPRVQRGYISSRSTVDSRALSSVSSLPDSYRELHRRDLAHFSVEKLIENEHFGSTEYDDEEEEEEEEEEKEEEDF